MSSPIKYQCHFTTNFMYLCGLCSVLGIASYKVTGTGCKVERLRLLWCILSAVAMTSAAFYISGLFVALTVDTFMVNVLKWSGNVAYCGEIAVAYISAVLHGNQVSKYINDLVWIDYTMEHRGIHISIPQSTKRCLWFSGIILAILSLFIGIHDYLVFDFSKLGSVFNVAVFYVADTAIYLATFVYVVHYCKMMLLLKPRFEALQKRLTKISSENVKLFDSLEIVGKTYHKLWVMSRRFDRLYANTIFFCMARITVFLTFSLYFLLVNKRRSFTEYVARACILSVDCFRLFAIVISSAVVKRKAEEILTTLQRISTHSCRCLLKVSLLHLQIQHETVSFTALGMFELNSSLIASILAFVMSYAFILIQFETTSIERRQEE